MRVMITGARGQLGSALMRSAPQEAVTLGLARADCDIGDAAAVQRQLDAFQPTLLINAAAYTAVDRAEEERAAAMAANASAPGLLAEVCAARGVRFFHVSTDFVFDGRRSTPYPPEAATAPLGVYGETKLAGERAVQSASTDALIMRTGWVYAMRGHNFLRTMLRLHRERDELAVVADQVGTPTRDLSLASALWAAAERSGLSGLYHWSDAGVCSWYDFAQAIGEEAEALGLLQRAAAVRPLRSIDYPTPATRPAYSVLDKTRSWADLQITPVHWRVQLRATLKAIKEHEDG
ncbi:MAG: dTDP-4-dehydrorhamnose reductase [Halieaceae bacterium]|jgi:dTDP-4-dehydrorhamnose reductase